MNKVDQILLEAGTTGEPQVWFTRPEAKRAVKAALAAKQADIDLLMLEFCPERMTEQQIVEWEKAQVVCTDEQYNHVCRALGLPLKG